MLFPASCLATCCSAAPHSGHRCVLCVVYYLIVTVFCETGSVSLYSTHLLESYRNLLVMKCSKNMLNNHKMWVEGLMEWRFVWIWIEFADWSNVRHNLDERLAKDVVKYFAVQSTLTCAQSLCAAVYTVRGSTECYQQQATVSHNKLYTVQCAYLHNICINQSCGPAFII